MASIRRRPDGMYRARYRDAAGKEHARHFARRVDAQRWLDEVTASVMTGMYVDPKAGRVTFRAYAAQWQVAQLHRRNTEHAVSSALKVHLLPAFGDRPLSTIRRGEVQALVQRISQTRAPSTVATIYQHLRSIMSAAVKDRLIAVSPCTDVTLPKPERGQVVPLPTETVKALATAMPERLRTMVTTMAGTGLRPGESAGLTVDRVDFLRRTVRVDRQLLQTRPPSFGPPKTPASVRTVPLPQVVADALAAHLAAFPAGEHGLIFCQRDGRPLNRDKVMIAFRKATRSVGAPEGTHLHELRHFYASLLIRHGASVKVVQARLGHKTAKETLDTYSHMWPDDEDSTRAAVDEVLGSSGARVEESG